MTYISSMILSFNAVQFWVQPSEVGLGINKRTLSVLLRHSMIETIWWMYLQGAGACWALRIVQTAIQLEIRMDRFVIGNWESPFLTSIYNWWLADATIVPCQWLNWIGFSYQRLILEIFNNRGCLLKIVVFWNWGSWCRCDKILLKLFILETMELSFNHLFWL